MNLKAKMKRFCTRPHRCTEGFTLVELIVVIAILAILGGVAVPAYGAYLEKAERAGDEQLLAAINTAFAAACIDEGKDHRNLDKPSPVLTLDGDNSVGAVTKCNEAFQRYITDIADEPFSKRYDFKYDDAMGIFKFWEDGATVSLKYGSGYVTVSAEDAKKLANSTFINADTLGAQALMDKVNFVADVAGSIDSGSDSLYNEIIGDLEYKKAFLKNLGVTDPAILEDDFELELAFEDEFAKMSKAMLDKMAEENNWTDAEKASHRGEADGKVFANMAVLYAAQNTKNLTDADINKLLTSTDPKELIKGNEDGGGNQLAQASLYYGMYVAYAHSKGDQNLIDATTNPFEFFASTNTLDTAGFKEYLNTPEGKADLEAYRASMNIVVDSTKGNEGAVSDVIVNGFNDDELVDLIEQAVGK